MHRVRTEQNGLNVSKDNGSNVTIPFALLFWRYLKLQLEFSIKFSQSAYRCLWRALLFTPAGCLGGSVWLVLPVVEGSRVSWADGTHGGTLDPLSTVCCALLDVSMHSRITALYKSCIGCYSRFCSVCSCLFEPVQLDSVQEANTIHTFLISASWSEAPCWAELVLWPPSNRGRWG